MVRVTLSTEIVEQDYTLKHKSGAETPATSTSTLAKNQWSKNLLTVWPKIWTVYCREIPTVESEPTDPWSTRELFVKWRRWSHIHCSWDTRETLSQLAGYKRVQNYIKRMDNLDHKRLVVSREEVELLDVERQMEYQLAMQHQEVCVHLSGEGYWVLWTAANDVTNTSIRQLEIFLLNWQRTSEISIILCYNILSIYFLTPTSEQFSHCVNSQKFWKKESSYLQR